MSFGINLNSKYNSDLFISFAVMLSPALNILQNIMNDVYGMEDSSTKYRVVLTAIPMSIAILLCFRKYPKRFIVIYSIALIVLLFHMILFPVNVDYATKEAFRFTFPIVLASALCLSCVSDIRIIEESLYKVSWIVLLLVIFYVISFFQGKIDLGPYSMSMSYAMLLPMASFFSKKKWYTFVAFVFLLVVAFIIGSRGALICIFAYIIYDLYRHNKKALLCLVGILLVFFSSLSFFSGLLDNIGLSSRSLTMLIDGSFTAENHRDEIRNVVFKAIMDNPIIGLGVWGDRPLLIPKFSNAAYCHNIFLEIFLDFGLIMGFIILFSGLIIWIRIYIKSSSSNRDKLFFFASACLFPLLFSGSYLIEQFFGIFIGSLVVIKNTKNI